MIARFFGGLLGGALNAPFDSLMSFLKTNVSEKTKQDEIIGEAIREQIKADAEIRMDRQQNPIYWYVWALYATPLGIWFAAVCLDSVLPGQWNIADLPSSVKPYANQIFAYIFGSGAALGVFQSLAGAIRSRRR